MRYEILDNYAHIKNLSVQLDNEMDSFLENLYDHLVEEKIEQKDFAKKIGISPQYFSELLRGKKPLNHDMIQRIVKNI